MEEKTARGSKITARVSNSPRTPKFRQLATPYSKKRRIGTVPVAQIGSSVGDDHLPNSPVLINLKAKSGKVSFVI